MSDDREILELAAKAAGLRIDQRASFMTWRESSRLAILNAQGGHTLWNAFADDGDALRLCAWLGMMVDCSIPGHVQCAGPRGICVDDPYHNHATADLLSATRRAITRAAASLAKENGA